MLEALFSSRVRVRLLTIFLMNPNSQFHARALSRMVRANYSAIWKELINLESAGLLISESAANTKSYRLNPSFPILTELRSIILKTAGVGDAIREALGQFAKIQNAFVYGSFASGDADASSDIDVMIIGEVDLTRLATAVSRIEKDLGRAVNYIAYTPEEWFTKQREQDPFISNVSRGKKIMLIGAEDGLRTTSAARTNQTLQGARGRDQAITARRHARSRRRPAKSR